MYKAYAKLNLYLHVGDVRSDGFHEVRSITTKINLYDKVYIRKADDLVVECDGVAQEDNICYKAALYLKETYKVEKGAHIKIKKNIPIGAGLGGGSSDAATVIKGLVKLWGIDIDTPGMIKIGAMFGSDVPLFFLTNYSLVSGRGETVEGIDSKGKFAYLLLNFKEPISTKEVYGAYINKKSVDKSSKLVSMLCAGDLKNFIKGLENDLTDAIDAVDKNNPKVKSVVDDINMFISSNGHLAKALISGSGSSAFVVCAHKIEAKKVYKYIKNSKICNKLLLF